MGYRDEKASLRARVAELEGELAEKEDVIARLKGGTEGERPEASKSKVLDAPLVVVQERILEHLVESEGLEAIADVLRNRLRLEVTQVGRTLRGKQGTIDFELAMVDGQTRVRIESTYTDRRNGFFVAGPMGGMMASFFAGGILASLGAAPVVMAAGLALVAGTASLGLLRLIRGVVRGEQANVAGTFEAVLALAEEHAPKEPAVKARVEATEDVEQPLQVAEEAEEAEREA